MSLDADGNQPRADNILPEFSSHFCRPKIQLSFFLSFSSSWFDMDDKKKIVVYLLSLLMETCLLLLETN